MHLFSYYWYNKSSWDPTEQKCTVLLHHYYFCQYLICDSIADLLLEFIHGLRDALLPWLLVFLLHGRLQVLLQLLIQLGDRESTWETVGGRNLPQSPPVNKSSSWSNIFSLPSNIPLYPGSTIQKRFKTHAGRSLPVPRRHSLDL